MPNSQAGLKPAVARSAVSTKSWRSHRSFGEENRGRDLLLSWICERLTGSCSRTDVILGEVFTCLSLQDPSRDGERLHYDLSRHAFREASLVFGTQDHECCCVLTSHNCNDLGCLAQRVSRKDHGTRASQP